MKIPECKNLDLAYETGVHIGDGSMYKMGKHNRVAYYGNYETERKYFKNVLVPLVKSLFGKDVKVKHHGNEMYMAVYSKELVSFKLNIVKLPAGNKSQLKCLPQFITNMGIECTLQMIAGIFDTDGCVKLIKRRNGLYPRLRIALKNKEIIFQIRNILSNVKITSTICHNTSYDIRVGKYRDSWSLDINGFKNLFKFIQLLSIRNFNHLRKIKVLNENFLTRNKAEISS